MKRPIVVLLSTILLVTSVMTGALASPSQEADELRAAAQPELEEGKLVRILVPGSDVFYEMQSAGYDFAGGIERLPEGIEVDAILTEEQLDALPDFGVKLANESALVKASPSSRTPLATQSTDTVVIGRVDWFTTKGQGFLSVEAKSSAESDADLTLSWDSGSVQMDAFVDSGEYMYHRILAKVDGPRPETVTVTSSLGSEATAEVDDWLYSVEADIDRPGYQYGFIDGYMHPTEIYDRIEQLAEEHPDITEIVELPNKTNGYRRHAQAQFGSGVENGDLDSTFYVTSKMYGHEGGNDITVALIGQPGADKTTVSVDGNDITVHLVQDSDSSEIVSTAAEVVDAINAHSEASELVTAHLYRNGDGTGVVSEAAATRLSDFLSAPEDISREPFTIRALRIGKNRDGSKPGVLIQAQDHAREWVTPLVALEAAERLLANYEHDEMTKQIVENVDIFIIPSNNPDGAHYSFFDRNMQRRNMTNHCGPENSDPGRRGNWGVDLNRNYSVGSIFDGYSGGSFDCTSDTYAGPGELSEPEAQNVVWLAENFSNIKFFMTVHSYGGQLFWQPGAYIAEGRITTPRPPLSDEQYYWEMAEQILSNVKSLRDSVVQPRNVGGSADVLYSSAGNVREELYNNYGIYAFGWEIGGSQWDPDQDRWVGAGGFQPKWEEANLQYQEYASGVIKMFEIAMEYGMDEDPATTRLVQDRQSDGTVNVMFSTSEPAAIHYTTDGSEPTQDSPTYEAADIREPGEVIQVTETTTFRWISVDVKGNTEEERSFTVQVDINADGMTKLVEQFEQEGDLKNREAARSLHVHLTSVHRFEEQGAADKVVKHMKSFIQLLDHYKDQGLVSDYAYHVLKDDAEYLIDKWQ